LKYQKEKMILFLIIREKLLARMNNTLEGFYKTNTKIKLQKSIASTQLNAYYSIQYMTTMAYQ